MQFPKRITAQTLLITLLGSGNLGSYLYFSNYTPKIIRRIEEVKGASNEYKMNVPFPADHEKLSYNNTIKWEQTTFKTRKTPVETQSFYKTVFTDKNWELDSESNRNGVYLTKYKKDKQTASVMSSQQDKDITIASVEFNER